MHVMEECLSEGFLGRGDLVQAVKCPIKDKDQESHMLSGFGFINFICPKNLQTIAENVCNFEFQRKAVTIFRGAKISETLNPLEWKENSRNYVRKFYTKGGRFVEAILIPNFSNKEKPHEMLWNKVINLENLRQWCSISNSDLGIIIPNYNIVDHFKFYGISKPHLQEVLDIKSIHDNDNRLLIFNASCKVLLTIRVASETTLKEEISHCITDTNMLLLMFRDELKGSGVVVTGLVVYSGKNVHLESNCTKCQHFIVTREEFESAESINNFWEMYKEKYIFNKIKTRLPEGDKEKEFMAVTSKILPYLASYQYQVCCNTQFLPTLEKDATQNIKQAKLLLDRFQMEIAHSSENRIILKGDYGTGKTIICLKNIEILSKKLRDRETIYYINFHGKSELDYVISNEIKGLHQNIKVLKGDSTLSNIIDSKILPREQKAGTEMVHLFVDENNTESLTKEEVNTLVELFTKKEHFKESKILLATQPIEIKRTDFHYIYGEESEYSEYGNKLHELEKIMTVKCLQHVMRTTVEINSLIEITQEYLNEKSNQYKRNIESSQHEYEVIQNTDLIIREDLIEDESPTVLSNSEVNIRKDGFLTGDSKQQVTSSEHGFAASENTQIGLSREPLNISSEVSNGKSNLITGDFKNQITISEHGSAANESEQIGLSQEAPHISSDVSNYKSKFLTRDPKSQITISKHGSTASKNIQTGLIRETSNSNSNVTQYQYVKTVDFDELHKLTFTEVADSGKNCQKRVTTYRYYFQSSIGHNISGPLPNLINLTYHNRREVLELFASLFQLTEIKAKKTAVIHFEQNNPRWLIDLFKLSTFPSLTIMDDVKNFLSNENDRVVLVKNYNCVRGMEFSDVILLLDANEYHLKQFIPEAMARCQSNLSIVIKPAENDIVLKEGVMDLIEYWMKLNLEEEKKFINILEMHFCECTSAIRCSRKVGHENLYCKKTREGYATTYYEVHKNSQSYKKMSEEIKQKIVSNTSLDRSGKIEALKRMDVHFYQSRSKMVEEMKADYCQWVSEMYSTTVRDGEDDASISVIPLHVAACENNVVAVKCLLESSACVNEINDNGDTALHLTAFSNSFDAMQVLLNHGASVDAKNNRGHTAFHNAAGKNHLQIMKLLMENGASIHERGKYKETAFHLAAFKNSTGAMKMLLQYEFLIEYVDKYGQTAMHHAAFKNNTSAMKILLKHGASVNIADIHGRTALHLAAIKNSLSAMKVLLQHGASVSDRGENGLTALHFAAYKNSTNAMKLLLQRGACVNDEDNKSQTAFHHAVLNSSIEAMEYLLQQGAFLDKKDNYGRTALHHAAEKGQIKAMNLLLQRGMSTDNRDNFGRTALHLSSESGSYGTTELLLRKGASVNAGDDCDRTAFHLATARNNIELMKLLLKHNASINDRDHKGRTAFHDAVKRNSIKAMEILLQCDVFVDNKDNRGQTVCHTAASSNSIEAIELLLLQGASCDIRDEKGKNPFHIAASKGHIKIMKILMEHGASVDERSKDGRTAFHLAARYDRTIAMKLLLQHGSSIGLRDCRGQTAYHVAAENDSIEAMELLLQNGPGNEEDDNAESALHLAASKGNIQIVQMLLKHGVTVDGRNKEAQTPLHLATRHDRTLVMKLLLQHRASVNAINSFGQTALHLGTFKDNNEAMKLLLQYGASAHDRDREGRTAFLLAANKSTGAMELLLKNEAMVNDRDKKGRTAFHAAAFHSNIKAMELLLQHGAVVDVRDKDGRTPFHSAASGNSTDAMKMLLQKGSSVNERDFFHRTAIHDAAYFNSIAAMEFLLQHGNCVDDIDKDGRTPFHSAAKGNKVEAMEMLLQKGASINVTDNCDGTAFHLAAYKNSKDAMKYLLKSGASVNMRDKSKQTAADIVQKGNDQEAKDILNNHFYKLQQSKLL